MTDYTKQLVEQRRELHQWPEEGWTEFWTTNYIVNKLRSWGYARHKDHQSRTGIRP